MSSDTNSIRFVKQFYDCCIHLALDITQPEIIQRFICINIRLRQTEQGVCDTLHDTIFQTSDKKKMFVDWDKTKDTYKMLSDSAFWIFLFETYCNVKEIENSKQVDSTLAKMKCVEIVEKSLKKNNIAVSWKNTIFLFLLINVARVSSINVTTMFLSKILKEKVEKKCINFIGDIADTRYTEEDYVLAMEWVLKKCITVDNGKLADDLNKIQSQNAQNRDFFAVRNVHINSGRIRLRDRLANMQNKQTFTEYDTFESFQININFASNVSYHVKLKIYMIMSQENLDRQSIFKQIFPENLHYVLSYPPVNEPEIKILNETIGKIRYTQAPFPALTRFYEECFKSISLSNKSNLSLSTIMQLYMCIYQKKKIWQKCWMHILPVMNAQIIRDVEHHLLQAPQIDVDGFVYALQSFK